MRNFPQQPRPVPPQVEIPQDFPPIPQEIVDRFPESARDWQKKLDDFWTRANQGIQQAQNQTAQQVNSSVVFNVDSFLIYANGVPTPMFALDASGVRLGNVLTINTPGNKVYIGAGNYANDDTPFFIDTLGNFSLGASLTWDPSTDTLTVTGTIIATSGTIGGFDIGSDYIRDTANTFGLASTVTGGDDVRLWAGETFANRGTAPFRVTEGGVVYASFIESGNLSVTAGTSSPFVTTSGIFLTGTVQGGVFAKGVSVGAIIKAGANNTVLSGFHFEPFSFNRDVYTGLTAIGFYSKMNSASGAGTIDNAYGLYIDTVNIGVNNYGIYVATTAPSFFGGTLLIGNADTTLYRSAANTLKTDDAFIAVGSITGAAGSFTTLAASGDITMATAQRIRGAVNTGAYGIVFGTTAGTDPQIIGLGSGSANLIFIDANTTTFRASDSSTNRATLDATGLAVTGGLSVTGLAGVGTRNVVVDAAGVMSAP